MLQSLLVDNFKRFKKHFLYITVTIFGITLLVIKVQIITDLHDTDFILRSTPLSGLGLWYLIPIMQ